MFSKKIIVKRQKHYVYIQLPSLYDISDTLVKNKINKLAGIFSDKFYVRLSSCNKKIKDQIQDLIKLDDFIIEKLRNHMQMVFNISVCDLINLISNINFDDTSVELILCAVKDKNLILKLKDIECDFLFYLCDNDGPFILFNDNVYGYKDTLVLIKKIINDIYL